MGWLGQSVKMPLFSVICCGRGINCGVAATADNANDPKTKKPRIRVLIFGEGAILPHPILKYKAFRLIFGATLIQAHEPAICEEASIDQPDKLALNSRTVQA